MKKHIRLSVFIFIFSFLQLLLAIKAATGDLPFPNPDVTISMDFQDAGLKDILKIFSIQSGLNFIASEAVQDRKMTLYLDKVTIKEAMDKIFKANNIYYELDKYSNIFIVKDWGRPQIETVTKVYYLKYQSVVSAKIVKEKENLKEESGTTTSASTTTSSASNPGDLTNSIRTILTEYGKVTEDAYTNSLIITDIPSRFPIIDQLIARLDVPQPLIMLEVEILDVNKDKVDKIGLKFGQTPMTLILKGAKLTTPYPFPEAFYRDLSFTKTFTPGSLDFSTAYNVTLDFLRTQSDTKTLARPKILTLNNETAEIKITTQESTNPTTTTNTDTSTSTVSVERTETGVSLRVTPQVNLQTGEITMFIMPKVSETKSGLTVGDTTYKDPEERSTKSIVRVKDNETVIIGGLIRNEFSQTITKLPILGDLPILGALFRHKNKDKDRERELLIFITPHIVRDGKIELAQAKKTSLPEREQNTVSGIDRRTIIEASLNSFDKKK